MRSWLMRFGIASAMMIAIILVIGGAIRCARELLSSSITASSPPAESRPFLIIGEEWPPFEYRRDGRLTGIDIEVIARIMGDMGVDYRICLYPWSRVKMMAQRGEADAVLSISYKRSREAWLFYTPDQRRFLDKGIWPEKYLWKSEYVFFCKQVFADKIAFESYHQIRRDGYRVGIVRDYSYDPDFRTADLCCVEAPDFQTGMRWLAEGRCDLFPADRTVGLATIKRLGLAEDLTHLPRPLFAKPYLMPAVRHSPYTDRQAIVLEFYRRLRVLRASGEYERIHERYIR